VWPVVTHFSVLINVVAVIEYGNKRIIITTGTITGTTTVGLEMCRKPKIVGIRRSVLLSKITTL